MTPLRSLSMRLVAGALLWCMAAFIVGGLVLASLFKSAVERALDERLQVIADTVTSLATVRANGDVGLRRPLSDNRFDRVFSGWYWQIDVPAHAGERARVLAHSRSLWDAELDLPAPARAAPDAFEDRRLVGGPDGQTLRALSRPVGLLGADRRFRLTVAADVSGMHQEIAGFNTTLWWSLGLMGAVLIVTLLIQVRIGLSPLGEVRRGLTAVRSGEAQRLTGHFPLEIEPLAQEVNRLLDHNRAVVERARTQVGNLAHALKTPLSVLSNASKTEAGLLGPMVGEQTGVMRAQVERYLARARTAASAEVLGARSPVRPVIEDIVRTLSKINRERGLSVEIDVPEQLLFRGERADLEEIAGNLLDNAFKWARGRIRVGLRSADVAGSAEGNEATAFLRLAVGDDGPGLPVDCREQALRRGARLDETVPGSGLGLSIVGDIVDAYRGHLALEESALGGLEAVVMLPRA